MYNFFSSIELIFGSYPFLAVINSISLLVKLYILYILFSQKVYLKALARAKTLLLIILIGGLFEDVAWLAQCIKYYFPLPNDSLTYSIIVFFINISWFFFALEYQALALFLENLVNPELRLNLRKKIFLVLSGLCAIFGLFSAFIKFYGIKRSPFILTLQALVPFYGIFILMPITIFFSIKSFQYKKRPRILNKQFYIFIQFFTIPRLITDLIQYYPFRILKEYASNCYSIVGISTALLTIALYFCTRKVMGFRFLNFHNHVQDHQRYNFVDGFKDVLEALARASSIKELSHITQSFFKTAFKIPGNRVSLHLRITHPLEENTHRQELSEIETHAEIFLTNQHPDLQKCINKVKTLIYDEIDFSNFYDPNHADQTILHFLDTINADIFLPIYKNHTIIGYIIVERYARIKEFYSHIERDEMIVYASYLGNIINLLQNRNLDSLIYQEKELKEELYKKHQEINQYKESIHSFFKNNKHKDIGIIFYKQRHFVFANQAAKEIIKININANQGSPLTKSLKTIAQKVEEFKSPQSVIIKNGEGERIVISGIPNLEKNHVIITVYYPDFTDILTMQINQLKDPSSWDYLLYLETTKPGQLINQLIPSSGEQMLQFKIQLLQLALSKKALLLEMSHEDLLPTVELLHHISLRTSLHVLTLTAPSRNHDIAIKLFGMNPIFGIMQESKSLLEKLDNLGTLFIQNIEYLDLETQEYLAEFLKYGYYKTFKSDQKNSSAARVICSTNKNLSILVQEGTFSVNLLNELKKASISMPSLVTLPDAELADLAQGMAQQVIKNEDFKTILDLNAKDKNKILQDKPASMQELKSRVQQILLQKSKENNIDQDIQFDTSYTVSDPDLVQAARLGKNALRDPRIMHMLWHKFKNQNKMAAFLGVNRSSINRRCKEYNIY